MSPIALQASINRRTAAAVHGIVIMAALDFAIAHQTITPVILIVAASIAAWFLVDAPVRMKPLFLPAWALNVVVLIGAGHLGIEIAADLQGGNQSVIVSLAHFVLVLAACKLFERKTMRDVTQIIVLAFLITIAGALYSSTGLWFTLALVGFLALMTYAAGALYLRGEVAIMAARQPAAAALIEGVPRLKRDLRVVAKACVLLALGPALLFFLAAPRTRTLAPPWGMGQLQTGYSDDAQFRQAGTLVQSDVEVMTVRITCAGEPVGSPYDEPYFRGSVQEDYIAGIGRNGLGMGSWREYRPASLTGEPVNVAQSPGDHLGVTPFANESVQGGDICQEYHMFISKGPSLFCLATPVAFGSSRIDQIDYFPQQVRVRNGGPYAAASDYVVYSRPHYAAAGTNEEPFVTPGTLRHDPPVASGDSSQPGPPRPSPDRPRLYAPLLHVPDKIMALARDLAAGYLTTDYDDDGPAPHLPAVRDPNKIEPVVRLFENYLRTNYPYSLTYEPVDPKLDPTTDFILNRKTAGGYCEDFAAAQVMLCRAVGINARRVAGYHGGEFNSLNGEYIVRERDAHVWTETCVPGAGWIISDPTPSQGELKASDGTVGIWLRDLSQYVENAWLTSVASFDNDSRRSIWQWVASKFQYVAALLQDAPHVLRVALWDGLVGASLRWILGATLLAIGLVLGWVARRWYAGSRYAGAKPAARAAARQGSELTFLDELMHLMERLGAARKADQTPREFAEALRGPLGGAYGEAVGLIDVAYGIRFGGGRLDGAARRRVAEALLRVRAVLRVPRHGPAHTPPR